MFRTFFVVVMSYAAAAFWSDHVFMDLTKTHWTSLWVYFWIAASLPFSAFMAVAGTMIGTYLISGFRV